MRKGRNYITNSDSTVQPQPFTAKPLKELKILNALSADSGSLASSFFPVTGDAHLHQEQALLLQHAGLHYFGKPKEPALRKHPNTMKTMKEHGHPTKRRKRS